MPTASIPDLPISCAMASAVISRVNSTASSLNERVTKNMIDTPPSRRRMAMYLPSGCGIGGLPYRSRQLERLRQAADVSLQADVHHDDAGIDPHRLAELPPALHHRVVLRPELLVL